jgi:23S rRNA (cytidine1920-2'-O)/16S rRNA (cytidine1409-2'-O)-methyltransferase
VTRRRLDAELVRRGLAASRTEAQAAVRGGKVTVHGRPAAKPSTLVDPADPVELVAPTRRFVSRAGEKLDAALARFGFDAADRRCLDAGASTGGFTDCLLRRGASHVVAVDVGYGQLAWSLRTDERVTVLERTNVRELGPVHLPYAPDLVTADLSFISLSLVVPALAGVAAERADLVLLVKPQFEAGPKRVGRGGVVRDADGWRDAISGVVRACEDAGLAPRAVMASPLPGPAGNVEFPLHAVKGEDADPGRDRPDVDAAIDEARRIGAAS